MFVHELVATQAEAAPDALAIVGDKPLTYGELNARANQLAHRLGSLGVRSDLCAAGSELSAESDCLAARGLCRAGGLDSFFPSQETSSGKLADDGIGWRAGGQC